MSQKEADRLHVIKLLLSKQITQKKAAKLMNLSKSQTIRVKKAYKKFGVTGLIYTSGAKIKKNFYNKSLVL